MVDNTPRGRGPRRRQRSEGFEAEGDPRLDDDEDELNDSVVDSIPASEPLSEVDSDRVEDFSPRNRMRDVAASSRSTQYQQEYRLKLVHRMLMRGVPLDQIAQELQVSVRTVQRDRTELFSRLREAARKFDLNHYIGDMLGFYGEASAMAMRAASASKTPINHRLAAIRTAVGARSHMTRMLNDAGVFDVVRYKPEKQKGNEDIRRLTDAARTMFGEGEVKTEEQNLQRGIPESALFDKAVLDEDEEEIVIL
jgi:hypothetical protein